MNLTTAVAKARVRKPRSDGWRHASSLLGGALLGTSIVTPILAGGDVVDGDAFVMFFSGLLTVLGIGMHVAGSGGTAHVLASTASAPTVAEDYAHSVRARRRSSADASRLIV